VDLPVACARHAPVLPLPTLNPKRSAGHPFRAARRLPDGQSQLLEPFGRAELPHNFNWVLMPAVDRVV
jgi:hypothetical protein